jgi:hypothetical protein
MNVKTKIVLKSLLELEDEINSGKTAWAAGINHGNAAVHLIGPGRYHLTMEVMGKDNCAWTSEEATGTLSEFIESIEWDETEPWDLEFKAYMGQQIWFVGDDIDPWDDENFVWPENYIDSREVMHAAQEQAAINRQQQAERK